MGGWLGEWVAGSPSDIRANRSSTETGNSTETELAKIFENAQLRILKKKLKN